jgi:hypothetical protein
VDLTDYKPHQIARAKELIEDGAIVPLRSSRSSPSAATAL